MKKFIVAIVLILFVFNISSFAYANEPTITSESAILFDGETGKILFEKNSHKSMYPASTTKILTAIIALENSELNDRVIIAKEATLGIDGSHIALEPGEILTMKDLLHALLIESANDAAKAIAIHISGSVEEFAKLMNSKAKEIGAKNSNFVNPNGLPNDEHVTTAYDLGVIARYAMENEVFADIVKNYLYTIDITNKKSEPRYLKSSNRLLYSNEQILVDGKYIPIKYFGAKGIKTGYTIAAQNCLVSAATRNNQTLISVVLKANGRNVYVDTHNLFNYGFENFTIKQLSFKNEFIKNIPVESGIETFATTVVSDSVKVAIEKNQIDKIIKNIELPEEIIAPIENGQSIGKIEYSVDDEVIGSVDIISAINVEKKPLPSIIDIKSKKFILKRWWIWPIIILFLIIANLKYRQYKRRKRRKLQRYVL